MPLRPKNKSWTEEDNQRLKAMVVSGATPIRAAAAFCRSIISVQAQARKIGQPFPAIRAFRRKWREAEETDRGTN